MKDTLTPAQISSYRENGFLAIENFLDAAELEQWRVATEEAVADRLKDKGFHNLNNQGVDRDEFYKQVFIQCLKLADTHKGMHDIMHDPRLGRIAGTLAGVEGLRLWHDQALIKPPFGNPTAWHLDCPYWSFSSRDAISVWVALDDATLANGCMAYIPGSHKTARFENVRIRENFGELFKVYPEWKSTNPVVCPVPAGSAVFHNGLTAHGAGVNMTNRPRRAMTCAFMPDGATFNGTQNVLPKEYFESLKIGDVLNDDRINPLVWRK